MLLDVWIKRIVGVYRLHGVDHQGLRHLVDLQLFKVKHVKYSIGACGFRGLLTRSPRGRTSTNRILPRCARDVFCSSPFVSLRLPTDFLQNPSPSIFLLRREGDCYRDPQWGGGNKKILPRCARDVFCSSPFVSLRLPTDFSQNPSPSIFLLRREGDSNPRYTCVYDSLANCWFQPLTHLSGSCPSFQKWKCKYKEIPQSSRFCHFLSRN